MNFIQLPGIDTSLINTIDFEQPDKLFEENDFESGSFFKNQIGLFKSMLIVILANIIFLIVRCFSNIWKLQKQCLKKIIDKFSSYFHFTTYLRIFIEGLLFIYIGSMLECSQYDHDNRHEVSYSIAIITMTIASLAIFLIPVHYFVYKDGGKIESRYFSELYDGTKDTCW